MHKHVTENMTQVLKLALVLFVETERGWQGGHVYRIPEILKNSKEENL